MIGGFFICTTQYFDLYHSNFVFEAWMDQLSSSEDCGMEIRSTDKNSGFIESTHYYMKEGEDRLKCKWEISTECEAVEWMFDKFDFEDKTNSIYYDSIFDDIKLSDRKEIEEVEKVFYCLSDNVQVTSGDYATKKYCAFDDSNDYDDEDFNKLYDDPSGGSAMDWNLIQSSSKFTIKYQTKHLIYGFKINWRCATRRDETDETKL